MYINENQTCDIFVTLSSVKDNNDNKLNFTRVFEIFTY